MHFFKTLKNYFTTLCNFLSVVHFNKYQNLSYFKIHLLAIIVYFVNIFYGVVLLHWESDLNISIKHLLKSPYIFPHQIYHPAIWSQSDIIILAIIVLQTAIFLNFLFKNPINKNYVFVSFFKNKIVLNEKRLNVEESKIIVKSYKTCLFLVKLTSRSLFFVLMLYSYFTVWLNNVFKISFLSGFYWLLWYP